MSIKLKKKNNNNKSENYSKMSFVMAIQRTAVIVSFCFVFSLYFFFVCSFIRI